MAFATRADLLARSSARRLAQLSVPTDVAVPPDAALRVAIEGGDVSGYSQAEQDALALALLAIDKCLADADALIVTYNIPATVQTSLLARLASTVALYYLQGAERMTDDVKDAYKGVMDMLKSHSRGDLSLIPADQAGGTGIDDTVQFASSTKRYQGTDDFLNPRY
ncbi:MAG: hypothetical protein CTY21_11695 [Methylomonas sp.]|nr:MAG: hypothetical protein CTY21_11695 [Methylomonas sp.]